MSQPVGNLTDVEQQQDKQVKQDRREKKDEALRDELCERPVVLGLRCDEAAELQNGSLVLRANERASLLLIGRHLAAELSVALTGEPGEPQADCTHADRVRSVRLSALSGSVASVELELPSSPGAYYLCVREPGAASWRHQGADAWLRVYVRRELLALHMKVIVIAGLLLLSGLFSGLNLGLMALDKNELQVIISCGSEREKRYARAIEPVRRRGNYLLCSILFANVLVNSTIAVLLEELTSGLVAVITSTVFIVMFGEILPQAFCSRHGLAVGAKTVALTYFCMVVTFPLSFPVSACLDWVLGEEIGHAYDRERLMEFIRVTRDYNNLETDEVNIISGALKLKRIQLAEVMTRIEDVFMLDAAARLDFDTILGVLEQGYSRVPVHEPGNKKNIVALLLAKDLALLDPNQATPLQTLVGFYGRPLMFLFEDTTLDAALDEFKTGRSHLAFVRRVLDDGDRDPVYEITGIVTLEDVIEEIMQMEINDETDLLSDNRRKRRRREQLAPRRDLAQFARHAHPNRSEAAPESASEPVSAQLRLAAYQFLATSVAPFVEERLSDAALRRLLTRPLYHTLRADAPRAERRLFVAGEPCDHFVMILEGRAQVVCGQERLVFAAGPFSHFGQAALEAPPADATGAEQQAADADTLSLGANSSRADQSAHLCSSSESRLPAVAAAAASSGQQRPFFVPDYTLETLTDCSYLKVSRAEYLVALGATLNERHFGETDLQNSA